VLWIRTHFFRIRINIFFGFGFGFESFYSYFDPTFFEMVSLIAFISFWNLYDRGKVVLQKNIRFFSFSPIFHKKFYFTTVSGSQSKSKSDLYCISDSDSDSAKIFGFFRIRIHNTAFKCLICDFSQNLFILQQCLDPNPNPNPNFFRIRIQPKYLYSYGFGSTTLVLA
jgi:hypothetical protein